MPPIAGPGGKEPTAAERGGGPGRRARIRASPRYPAWVLVTCMLGMFASTFTATILSVSIKVVAVDLGSSTSTVAWVLVAPMLAGAVAMPILGRLGDIKGHGRDYLVGFSIALVFSVLTALAWNAASLIAFRTLGQLAGTATNPASMALLFRIYPPEDRLKVSGRTSAVMSAAVVCGLVIGGPLVDVFGWRPLFWIQAGLSVVALAAALVVLPTSAPTRDIRLDRLGALVLAVSAFALTFGVNRLPVWGVQPVVVACAAVFLVGLVVLVRVERRQPVPVLPLDLLKVRNVRAAWGASFLTGIGFMGTFVVTPLLLLDVFGLSLTATSGVTLFRTGAVMTGSLSARAVAEHIGSRAGSIAAAASMAVGTLILAGGAAMESLPVVVVGLVISGFGSGAVQPANMAMLSNSVSADDVGLAASMQQTTMSIGSVTATSLFSTIVTGTADSRFAVTYLLATGSAALCTIACTRISPSGVGTSPARRRPPTTERA